jgi:transcriptional regulator with GAF, ATPase, and Fis domain
MVPPDLTNRKERLAGESLVLRLAQSASIDDVLNDFAKIAAEKGICLCSVRFTRGKLKHEFELPNSDPVSRRINELAVDVEGGQTRIVVKYVEPTDGMVVSELVDAAHLAAHRIEILAGGWTPTHQVGRGSNGRSVVIDELVGESEPMQEVRRNIAIAAGLDLSVLITGEPGTGKELVARGIHNVSSRADKPFVAVNCAALNLNLIESELFGHEKGAFTGALARKLGRFERANGGTLFLDEIGDLPAPSQAMLLRVLQEREFERVGGTQAIKIDIRLIAATNHDLLREVNEGSFRRDLYDRLCGYPIQTPALRERPTDIPILIRHYFPDVEFEEDAMKLLCRYAWKGNVRQLISTIERLAAKAGGRIVTTGHVRREMELERQSVLVPINAECFPELREGETVKDYIWRGVMAIYERERFRSGSHSAAAQRLGINRTTLYDWLERARRQVAKSTKVPNS